MKSGFWQFLLMLALAGVLLAGGWLGICNLGLVLPSGSSRPMLHDMAALSEERFAAALPAPALSPFTADGLPEDAVILSPQSPDYKQYSSYIADFFASDPVLSALQAYFAVLPAELAADEEPAAPVLALLPDERGLWLLAERTLSTEQGSLRLQSAFHSQDGFRLFRIAPRSAAGMALSPDASLILQASGVCSQLLSLWTELSAAGAAEADSAAMILDEAGELAAFPLHMPQPTGAAEPQRTELDGTRCHVYYPAVGGSIVLIYDFIGSYITGAAFIPTA